MYIATRAELASLDRALRSFKAGMVSAMISCFYFFICPFVLFVCFFVCGVIFVLFVILLENNYAKWGMRTFMVCRSLELKNLISGMTGSFRK